MKRGIRLRGISGPIKGMAWSNDRLLRAGRLASLELLLDDSSVSRKHAEVRLDAGGDWCVVDLDSTNGTYVNGNRVPANTPHPVRTRDIVQFGKLALMVELTDVTPDGPPSDQLVLAAALPAGLLETTTGQKDRTGPNLALSPNRDLFDREKMPRAGEQLVALLRAGRHLSHLQSEDQLLDSILYDAVSVLDAQRGAIVLADGDGPDPKLRLRCMAVGPKEPSTRHPFSKRLVHKAFAAGESMLFTNLTEDDELRMHQSIADGAMASVLCVLLRTPRRKIGVLHLDRGYFQTPFSTADLHLADALASHVSAGIECAHLLRKQQVMFLQTIEMLADAIELKDKYTGGHTRRVTRYALMVGEKLELPGSELDRLRLGTPLHDIGKVGISDAVLRKPGRLTAAEFAEMQQHTTLGAELLAGCPDLAPIIPIVRNHHERWDGTGYPDRLAGEEIPLLARIVAVCDAYDAMTSERPYHENKKGKPPEFAFAEVERQSRRQFDPRVAAAFLEIKEDIRRVMYELMPGADRMYESGPPTLMGGDEGAEMPIITGDSYAELHGIG